MPSSVRVGPPASRPPSAPAAAGAAGPPGAAGGGEPPAGPGCRAVWSEGSPAGAGAGCSVPVGGGVGASDSVGVLAVTGGVSSVLSSAVASGPAGISSAVAVGCSSAGASSGLSAVSVCGAGESDPRARLDGETPESTSSSLDEPVGSEAPPPGASSDGCPSTTPNPATSREVGHNHPWRRTRPVTGPSCSRHGGALGRPDDAVSVGRAAVSRGPTVPSGAPWCRRRPGWGVRERCGPGARCGPGTAARSTGIGAPGSRFQSRAATSFCLRVVRFGICAGRGRP
jgi:hypothetical protein